MPWCPHAGCAWRPTRSGDCERRGCRMTSCRFPRRPPPSVPLAPRASLFAFASAGTTPWGRCPSGLPVPTLRAAAPDDLRAGRAARQPPALAGIGALHRVSQLPAPVGGRIHLAACTNYGSVFSDNQPDASAGCLGGGLLAETLAGPLFLGASLGGGPGCASILPSATLQGHWLLNGCSDRRRWLECPSNRASGLRSRIAAAPLLYPGNDRSARAIGLRG